MPVSKLSSGNLAARIAHEFDRNERTTAEAVTAELEGLRGWVRNSLALLDYDEGVDGPTDEARQYLAAFDAS